MKLGDFKIKWVIYTTLFLLQTPSKVQGTSWKMGRKMGPAPQQKGLWWDSVFWTGQDFCLYQLQELTAGVAVCVTVDHEQVNQYSSGDGEGHRNRGCWEGRVNFVFKGYRST